MKISIRQFADWCGGSYTGDDKMICGVAIDSRKVTTSDAFFAFKGERVNGEDYVAKALQNGASCAVVSQNYQGDKKDVIVVKDVLTALQQAAKQYRKQFDLPIVAITGSVGKTSTKDMMAAVLSQKYQVLATEGNYNNEIGLPLMLFKLTKKHQVAVLEMGMNHYGELTTLGEIAGHNIAVITNIGTAHIEFFGSKTNIAKAKLEIAEALKREDTLILNGKDAILKEHKCDNYQTYFTGRKQDALRAENVVLGLHGTQFDLYCDGQIKNVSLPLYGDHFVDNALLVVAAARLLGLSLAQIIAGFKNVKLSKMRFQFDEIGDQTFINDAYNASVDSIISSVAAFCQLPFKRHYAIIGDIFECGDYAEIVHREIGEKLNDYQLDSVIFVGDDIKYAAAQYNGTSQFCKKTEALKYMRYQAGDGILVKASRGMALETLIDDYRSIQNG